MPRKRLSAKPPAAAPATDVIPQFASPAPVVTPSTTTAKVDHAAVAADPTATLQTFTLDDLAIYTRAGAFDPDDSTDFRMFEVGRDDVHGVLKHLISRITRLFKLSMFGYDDSELDGLIEKLIHSTLVFVQGTLDKSQFGGTHEAAITAQWDVAVRAVFAVGNSATGQIEHTKGGIADGVVGFEGSTNWSASGEGTGIGLHGAANVTGYKAQANTLTVFTNVVEIRRFELTLDEQHASILARAAKAV